MKKKELEKILLAILIIIISYLINNYKDDLYKVYANISGNKVNTVNEVLDYNGKDYAIINNNEPNFNEEDKKPLEFEKYDNLDFLGRAVRGYACVSKKTMPDEKRGSISGVRPSGWHTVKYDNVEGKFLYNRCHLIAYQLTAENDNKRNLITCTRYANSVSMLKFENKVANYVHKTGNHVLYRATPIYKDSNLLASGIQLEAYSVEDNGKGIKFNVYIYNVQEGIDINYKDGSSKLSTK